MSTARRRSRTDARAGSDGARVKPETLRTLALALPEAEERETWGEATFRVRNRIFAMMDGHGKRASVKATRDEQQALVGENPGAYFLPPYVAQHGWIGIRLARARTDEVTELVTEAWRLTAPKRLLRTFDEAESRAACC
jgi:hypothetical protein